MHPHHYMISTHFTVTPRATFIFPSQVSSLAVQLFLLFQGKTEAWWYHLLLSGNSEMCVFMCADVCVHLSISLPLLHLPKAWWSLHIFFPGKSLWCLLHASLKCRQSQVQLLAWHIAILMILWPREETNPRDIWIFFTWQTLLLECQISIVCLQDHIPIITSKSNHISEELCVVCAFFCCLKDDFPLEFMSPYPGPSWLQHIRWLQSACWLAREEHWPHSMPVTDLFVGLSRRKVLVVDMSVSIKKKTLTPLFILTTHTSPNINILKLSLR